MSEIPEWLKVGEYVAVDRRDAVVLRKVERFTKTLVVLESDNRFRLDTLERRIGRWDPTERLRDPKDPDVVRRLKEQRVHSLSLQIENTSRDYYRRLPHERNPCLLPVLRDQAIGLARAIDALLEEDQ